MRRKPSHVVTLVLSVLASMASGCVPAAPPTSPPPTPLRLEVVSTTIGGGREADPLTVEIVDESGQLASAHAGTNADMPGWWDPSMDALRGGEVTLLSVAGNEHSVLLLWQGTPCDQVPTRITVSRAGRVNVTWTYTSCDLTAALRAIVLVFTPGAGVPMDAELQTFMPTAPAP